MEKTRKERQQEERIEWFKMMTAIITLINTVALLILTLVR